RHVNSPEVKIITVEDPIEYRLAGVEQTQADPEAHYTFASGLRSILRQDPDVILVGEIRDAETADIAMQAALTGHLVFSTLHTNDAAGAVPRLNDLGIKPVTIAPALSLVIAQRLVRKLCEKCKQREELSAELRAHIEGFFKKLPPRVSRDAYKTLAVYTPVGCEGCGGTGYRGRIGVFEFFVITPDVQDAILGESSERALAALARKEGMVSMQEDGILKTLRGITTLTEVEKATGPIIW
ncbi:MAG: ATPase, T2SS/T4P/T4SS family, partial [Patescibacteria group bacterium]